MALGDRHREQRQWADALACYDRAIALNPSFAEAHASRGAILLKQHSHAQALASCTRAVALDQRSIDGWIGLGRAFGKLKRYDLATGAFRRALTIDPSHPFLKGRLLQQMVLCCNWRDIAPLVEEIERDMDAGRDAARPFVWQAVSSSPRSLLRCAELFNRHNAAVGTRKVAPPKARAAAKLRIGYLSGEFRERSTAYLRVGIFEHHDRNRFELVAFDNGWDDDGATRARINRAIDRIVDVRGLSDDQAVAAIGGERIDILVDLNGFNGLHRTGVLARRPAPVQVTHPGYPGTLGADYIDYIVADDTIIADADFDHYAERTVRLPDSYQANDRSRPIADRIFTRRELGLPEDGIVFCCFNNNYKITAQTFESWARIMHTVPGSVLWLLADNAAAVANLRRAAEALGLDPARLIFAPRMATAEHLARHRCADLFLDTLPCNAHATASDALWAGLPILTRRGETFSGRVCASLLRAIDLPDLIVTTRDAYERTAIRLATDPEALADVKRRLAQNRLTTPLFDTARYTRHLEAAYEAMHRRYAAGLAPDHIDVAAIPPA